MERTIAGGLLIAAVLVYYGWQMAHGWWQMAKGQRQLEKPLGSDEPPPRGMTEFITAICDACGDRTDAAFKLEVLQTPEVTIAKALRLARAKVENISPGVGKMVDAETAPPKGAL